MTENSYRYSRQLCGYSVCFIMFPVLPYRAKPKTSVPSRQSLGTSARSMCIDIPSICLTVHCAGSCVMQAIRLPVFVTLMCMVGVKNTKARCRVWCVQMYRQLQEHKAPCLSSGSDDFADGERQRDFPAAQDAEALNFYVFSKSGSGIFNVGTRQSHSGNERARPLIRAYGKGKIEDTRCPDTLLPYYESFTKARLTNLRVVDYYTKACPDRYTGVPHYLR